MGLVDAEFGKGQPLIIDGNLVLKAFQGLAFSPVGRAQLVDIALVRSCLRIQACDLRLLVDDRRVACF